MLEKAKVISYEDLEEARAKRAAKEQATVNKRRSKSYGRTRKSPAPIGVVSVNGQRSAGVSQSSNAM